jgi:hypothetical protein
MRRRKRKNWLDQMREDNSKAFRALLYAQYGEATVKAAMKSPDDFREMLRHPKQLQRAHETQDQPAPDAGRSAKQ